MEWWALGELDSGEQHLVLPKWNELSFWHINELTTNARFVSDISSVQLRAQISTVKRFWLNGPSGLAEPPPPPSLFLVRSSISTRYSSGWSIHTTGICKQHTRATRGPMAPALMAMKKYRHFHIQLKYSRNYCLNQEHKKRARSLGPPRASQIFLSDSGGARAGLAMQFLFSGCRNTRYRDAVCLWPRHQPQHTDIHI